MVAVALEVFCFHVSCIVPAVPAMSTVPRRTADRGLPVPLLFREIDAAVCQKPGVATPPLKPYSA